MLKLCLTRNKNIKKNYFVMLVLLVISLTVVTCIYTIYNGYHRVLIDNAYSYTGRWDAKSVGIDKVDIAGLNYVAKIGFSGRSYIRDDGILSLFSCNQEDMEKLFTYFLQEGKWPENDNEIVLASDFEYNGLTVKNGTLKVGDEIEFEIVDNVTQEVNVTTFQIVGLYDYKYGYSNTYGISIDAFISADSHSNDFSVFYYSLRDYDIETVIPVKDYFDEALDGEVNPYIYDAVYMLYGTDAAKQSRYGTVILSILLIFFAIVVCIINMISVLDSEYRRNRQIYLLGGNWFQIFEIYLLRFNVLLFVSSLISFPFIMVLIKLLEKYLESIWNVFNCKIGYEDFSGRIFIVVILLIDISVALGIAGLLRNQLYPRKCREHKQKKLIRNIYDHASVRVYKNKISLFIFVLSLSISLITFSVVLPLSVNIQKNAKKVMGAGNGYDFRVMFNHEENIENDLSQISGVTETYKFFGHSIERTTFSEKDFIQEAKLTENYGALTQENALVEVCALTEELYNELSKFNTLPEYQSIKDSNYCIVYSRFIGKEDGVTYDTFAWTDDSRIDIGFQKKEVSVKPVANVSVPNYSKDVNFILTTIFVPEKMYRENISDIGTLYDIYVKDGYEDDVAAILSNYCEKKGFMLTDESYEQRYQRDRFKTEQIMVIAVGIMLVSLALIGIISSSKIEQIKMKKEIQKYEMLGMTPKYMNAMLFIEELHKLLDSCIVSIVLFNIILTIKGFRSYISFYDLKIQTIYLWFMCVTVLHIILLYLLSRLKKG